MRPIRQLDGEPGFAEVFLDDVFVPDEHVLGEVGRGWQVAMSTTTSERGLTLRSPGRFLAAADRLVELYADTPSGRAGAGHGSRGRRGEAWMDADAYRLYVLGTALRALDGRPIGAEASANKMFWSELDVAIHSTAMTLLGERATLTGDPSSASWLDGLRVRAGRADLRRYQRGAAQPRGRARPRPAKGLTCCGSSRTGGAGLRPGRS